MLMGCSKYKNIVLKFVFVNKVPFKMAAACIMFHNDRVLGRERVFRDRNMPLISLRVIGSHGE